ncbi:MAG: putative entry exclusion protein TrbK-alt [Lysobacteraceae bacterium]
MDGKMLARLGAVVFVAIAVTATALDMARKDEPSAPPSAPAFQPPADPLRETLRRCQQLGESAASDAECLRVWAETRDRFLGRDRSEAR